MTQEENKDIENIKESFIKINGENIGTIILKKHSDYSKEKYDLLKNGINNNELWEDKLKEYLDILKSLNKVNFSKISKEDLSDIIKYLNVSFMEYYISNININAPDLADEGGQTTYAQKLSSYIVSLQLQEIQKIGYKEFLFNTPPTSFIYYIDKDKLDLMRDVAITCIKNIEKAKQPDYKFTKKQEDKIYLSLQTDLISYTFLKQCDKAKELYLNNKEYYDKLHKIRQEIDKTFNELSNKINVANDRLLREKVQETKNKNNDINREKVNNKITTNYQLLDNRLHKKLNEIENAIDQPVNLQLLGKKKDTIINVELNIADTDIFGNHLNYFDILVINQAFNLYEIGNKQLTPELIYKEFLGKTPSKIGNDIYREIEKSLKKLIITRLKLNLTPEVINKLKPDEDTIKRLSIVDYALPMIESEIEYTNGKIKKGYIYKSEPIYFTLCKLIKQIKTIDRKLLAIDTGGSLTKERMLIRQYLSTEYERIKSTKANDKNKKDKTASKILYSSLFDKCELFKDIDEKINNTTDEKTLKNLQANKRTYKKRYIEEIIDIMIYWKKNKFIKGYNEYPKDKKIKQGIEITL